MGTHIEQDASKIASKGLSTAGPKQKNDEPAVGDAILQAERKDFTIEGKERIGFASSEVPTIEEKMMANGRSGFPQADSIISAHNHNDNSRKYDGTDALTYVANSIADDPADDYQQSNVDERDSSRSLVQKHQTVKLKTMWTVPIHRPRVDPYEFEDPISEVFWTNVWVASAAYNVCHSLVPYLMIDSILVCHQDGDISQGFPCYTR